MIYNLERRDQQVVSLSLSKVFTLQLTLQFLEQAPCSYQVKPWRIVLASLMLMSRIPQLYVTLFPTIEGLCHCCVLHMASSSFLVSHTGHVPWIKQSKGQPASLKAETNGWCVLYATASGMAGPDQKAEWPMDCISWTFDGSLSSAHSNLVFQATYSSKHHRKNVCVWMWTTPYASSAQHSVVPCVCKLQSHSICSLVGWSVRSFNDSQESIGLFITTKFDEHKIGSGRWNDHYYDQNLLRQSKLQFV